MEGDVIGNFFGGFDMSGVVDKIYFFVGIFLLCFVLGAIIFAFLIVRRRNKKSKNNKKVGWWQEVSGTESMEPTHMDEVEEIVIPGTTLRVFYCRKRDLWLPRFNRGISKDLFYVLLTPQQQMVNFTIKPPTKNNGAEIDHDDNTDMLWAAENTREFIKRNYRDKSEKWWKAYQGVITTAIFIFIMTFSMVIIIYFMRGIVTDLGQVAATISSALETSCRNAATSGVVPV